jgi:hypothetical protein
VIGVAIGLIAAIAAGPTLAGTLYATSPRDPLIFFIAGALLLGVTVLASYVGRGGPPPSIPSSS